MSERPKRRSRALEVLQTQTAEKAETDITEDEIDLISGLILRMGDIPKKD